jgi:hypothetical protein
MTASSATTVQYLNLAYFGRPADPASLIAFPAAGLTDEQIVEIFVKSDEYSTNTITPSKVGSDVNTTSLINTIYQRLFGRVAATSEVAGWTTALSSGTVNQDYLGITIMRAGLNLPVDTEMRKVLVAKFDSADAFSTALSNDPDSAAAYTTSAAVDSASSFLAGITTTTAATSSETAVAVSDMVALSNTGSAYALTSSTDTLSGTAKNDTFNSTNSTLGDLDTIDGGNGIDTLSIAHTSGSAFAYSPAANNVKNVEIVDVTNQTGSSAGSAETSSVTFKDLAAGQTISLAGVTFTAAAGGATAAQVAAAFVDGAITITSAAVSGGALSATNGTNAAADTRAEVTALLKAEGYSVKAGADNDSVTFTAESVGNQTNLLATGTAVSGATQVSVLTFAGVPGGTDNDITLSVNGVGISTVGVTVSANAAGLVLLVADIASDINAALGKTVAFHDGVNSIHIVSDTPITIGDYSNTGTSAVTTLANDFADSAVTLTLATDPGATTAFSFVFNGTSYSTATLAADTVEAGVDAMVAKINEIVGTTIATKSGTTKVVIENNGQGFALTNISSGSTTFSSSLETVSTGVIAAAVPTYSVVDGVAAVTAASSKTLVDVSKIGSATEAASVLSTGEVQFSEMTTQKGVVQGDGTLTNGDTAFTYKSSATSTDTEVQKGVTAGDITVTASGALTSTVTSIGSKNTVGAVTLDKATSVTIDAQAAFTASSIAVDATSKATLTVSGAGAASVGTLAAGFDTVNASSNSGGVTAGIGASVDTVFTGSTGNDTITASTSDTIASTEKLAVDAGAGTADTLVIAASNDVDAADIGARYTNFEVMSVVASQDVSLVSGISSILTDGDAFTVSGLNATNAVNITASDADGLVDDMTFSFKDGSGTSDAVSITVTDKTSTANIGIDDLTLTDIETANIAFTTGTSGTQSTLKFKAGGADSLKNLNLSGSADVHLTTETGVMDMVAIDINASALTGKFELTDGVVLVKGSKVTATSQDDTIDATDIGVTYDGGAGKDEMTSTAAIILADGSDDTVIDGGADQDTLVITGTPTLNDSHFLKVSNFEKMSTSSTASTSITAGTNFSSTFSNGFTYATATLVDTATLDFNTLLYTGDVTLTSVSSGVGNAEAEDINIQTGSGSDDITFTAASWVGHATTAATITVNTNAGDDKISVETGTLIDNANDRAIAIDAGTGKDTIKLVKVNGAGGTALNNALITVDAGDSLMTNFDVITGFDIGDATNKSDILDFTGTSAVSDFTQSVDTGVFKSHALSAGVVTFDTTDVFDGATKIDSSNLQDALDYLVANTANLDVVAFNYDSTGNGTADATMVYNNNSVDSLVDLQGVGGVTSLVAGITVTANALSIA